ncbi:MAG: hypothetical protein JST24_03160 [Acidobacteria bacterium]|nr:hypothetical protein [Acidobacteriota bacterium]
MGGPVKALLDLFARHRNRETGVWTLGQEPQRTIYLDQGLIAFAQSTHPLDKLTTLLVERGKLTQAQLDYALQNLKPGLSIGRNLIEMGFITQRDLLEVAKAQVERVVWGAMGNMEEEPRFQAHALDASVVRLSLDTPLTLLVGCLHLRDRERLLDLLGPLDQKLTLQSRPDVNLPQDLARMAGLFDGQRRLLDLAQETGLEPMRVGAFALYLREMGMARLQFGPSSEPEATPIQALPQAEPLPAPPLSPLLASIEAAARPTEDLRHLAGALDDLDADPVEALSPADEVPPGLDPEAGPDLRITAEASGSVDIKPGEPKPPRKAGTWVMALVILGGMGAYAGWRWTRPLPSPTAPVPSTAPVPESEVLSQRPAAPEPVPEPNPAPPQAEPAPAPSAVSTSAQRWTTLHKGDWEAALSQGAAYRAKLKDAWVLRLEVACQPDTLARAVAAFKEPKDLFLVPMAMKDGRTCRQVCLGTFKTQAEAEAAIQRLPALFTQGGNKPRPFQASQLPEKQ